ncbi:UNVERIFIED_CONTAM: hypothetical protein PYX00_000440 [Menopon gallinae]|uniref:Uncharacterized protein n=1 Tax=Menopon gallinae TaxID=328185 RepID=A0AAW2I910_9NEOP
MESVNNNKESFELLRGTPDSNSGSEVSEIVFPAKKKRFRRRLRNNPSTKHEDLTNECRCGASTVSLTLFCAVLICWLVTLTWLAVVLHGQLNRLNTDVAKGKMIL